MKNKTIRRLSDKEFQYVYSKVPRLCVDMAIILPQKGILLTKRRIAPAKGLWHTPGGTIRYKESIAEAAQRIGKQELGIEINIKRIIGVIEMQFQDHFYHDVVVYVLAAPKKTAGAITLDSQADAYAYFKKLPVRMIPAQKKFLRRFLSLNK